MKFPYWGTHWKLIFLAIEQHPNGSVSSFHVEPPKNVELVDFVQSRWNIIPEFKITDEIPMEHVKNILIATTWRSGSSFFGNILNQYPGTFYSYEPLHYLSNFVSKKQCCQLGQFEFNLCLFDFIFRICGKIIPYIIKWLLKIHLGP